MFHITLLNNRCRWELHFGRDSLGERDRRDREQKKKKHHKTFRMMKRQRANADNNTLGRSIYQNNLRLQANSGKMGPAFKMHQRYDKNAERKTHARGKRWISSSESLSLGRGFWESNEGLDTETPGCHLQTWPGSHPLHNQIKNTWWNGKFCLFYWQLWVIKLFQGNKAVSLHFKAITQEQNRMSVRLCAKKKKKLNPRDLHRKRHDLCIQ